MSREYKEHITFTLYFKLSAAACNCDTPSRLAAVKLTAIVNPTLLVSFVSDCTVRTFCMDVNILPVA